jgi:hypothetical protein
MQPREWEKISTNHVSDKGLVSRICKLLNKKTKKYNLKMGKRTEDIVQWYIIA